MKNYANLRFHSTFRFEAKNGLIKSFNYSNFKNICKSIAYRQEYWVVSKRLNSNWEKRYHFLGKSAETKNLKIGVLDIGFCSKYEFVI